MEQRTNLGNFSYTSKNATVFLQAVNFTSLLQLVKKLPQTFPSAETPSFSPPAPAPAKKTPAPAENM